MAYSPQDPSAALEKSLINLASESWRFARLFARLISKLDAGEGDRYASQLRYFESRLKDDLSAVGLSLVNLEGEMFDPGMAAVALNISDFSADDELLVDQMVEPIVVGSEGIKKEGTVMVRKANR